MSNVFSVHQRTCLISDTSAYVGAIRRSVTGPLERKHSIAIRAIALTPVGGNQTLILSTNVDQKSLESEFPIAICRPTGDKWQPKTLFLLTFDPHSSIVKSVFDCRLSGVALLNAPQVSMKPPDQLHRLLIESMSL